MCLEGFETSSARVRTGWAFRYLSELSGVEEGEEEQKMWWSGQPCQTLRVVSIIKAFESDVQVKSSLLRA
jgi:hypothetical protein